MTTGTLYLIPTPLGSLDDIAWLPAPLIQTARRLTHFIVEHPKSARQFLKAVVTETPLQQLHLSELNEHTDANALPALLQPLLQGQDVGLMSEAGCPGVADPGAPLIALCHERKIRVKPCVGPSSILLALMASGASGQRFAFHGYLPADESGRIQAIRDLEQRSREYDEAQLFIETPYRNNALLNTLLQTLKQDTWLTTATDLNTAEESIRANRIAGWPKTPPDLHKRPTVFVMQAPRKTQTNKKR